MECSAPSTTDCSEQAPEEGGLLGYQRAPHPEHLLKTAIASKDGSPTIGWVASLYTKRSFDLLKAVSEKIAASTLAECRVKDFTRHSGSKTRMPFYLQHFTLSPSR
jgi:hypothetical protein